MRFESSVWGALSVSLLVLPVGLSVLAVGCSSNDDSGESAEELRAGASQWSLPSSVAEVGAQVSIPYENAGAWNGGRDCEKQLREGSISLGAYLRDQFDAISSVGGYACRLNTADSSRMSVHATGRALDLMIPEASTGVADSDAGDPIANWLVVNSTVIGVDLIIWNHSIWRANGTNIGVYKGPIPHVDHIHVELTERGASKETPFFSSAGIIASNADADTSSGDPAGVIDYSTPGDNASGGDDYSDGTSASGTSSNTNPPSPGNSGSYGDGSGGSNSGSYDNGGGGSNSGSYGNSNSGSYGNSNSGSYGNSNSGSSNGSYGDTTGADFGGTDAGSGGKTTTGYGDAGSLPNPVAPSPVYPSAADDSVGEADSLDAGARTTPREAARQNVDAAGGCTLQTAPYRFASSGQWIFASVLTLLFAGRRRARRRAISRTSVPR